MQHAENEFRIRMKNSKAILIIGRGWVKYSGMISLYSALSEELSIQLKFDAIVMILPIAKPCLERLPEGSCVYADFFFTFDTYN